MRKFLSIFLILCLTTPFLVTYLWLQHERHLLKKDIKREIIAGINKKELEFLKFTRGETETVLNWHHSKEFEYEGEMYDVVERHEVGDSIYMWCWWDHEETQLNKKLQHLIVKAFGEDPHHKQRQQHLVHFVKGFYSHPPITFNYYQPSVIKRGFTPYLFYFPKIILTPPVPPPQFA